MVMRAVPSPRRRLLLPALPALLIALAGLSACQSPPAVPSAAPAGPAWSAAQVQALRTLGFSETEQGWSLSLAASLLFDFDSEQLDGQQLLNLQRMARTLIQVGIGGLRIEGHTDNVGVADYNLRLSQRRAAAVAQALAGAGMPAEMLRVRGFGKDKPVADNASEAGRARNRRVVLIAASS